MRVFTCPAKYLAHVEATLALALAEIGRDVWFRDDEDARIRALAPVPDHLIDPEQTGTCLIMVGVGQTRLVPDPEETKAVA
jgi:hypothetical protein